MRRMKGYDYSYRREITDRKGEYCPEKLHGLVEEMLSLWEEKLRSKPFLSAWQSLISRCGGSCTACISI